MNADFTSVLYLGMSHPHAGMASWRRLTTGRPAALEETCRSRRLAARLARLTGHEAATLGASTLHVFWDLFAGLLRPGTVVHVDAGTYPIARWGLERSLSCGVRQTTFAHHSADALLASLAHGTDNGPPVVVTDGVCPLSGRPAPLAEYAALCRGAGGTLVVDDTQGIGLFGRDPARADPYGQDGAGTPAWCGGLGGDVLVVGSLAKAFGAPLAVLAGRREQIERFEATSLTRVHCSPPAMAAVSAAEAALALNAAEGPARRQRLLAIVRLFRDGVARLGMAAAGGIFPVQTLTWPTGEAALELHRALQRRGVRTVLQGVGRGGRACVSFVLTCLHSSADIAVALRALERCGAWTMRGQHLVTEGVRP